MLIRSNSQNAKRDMLFAGQRVVGEIVKCLTSSTTVENKKNKACLIIQLFLHFLKGHLLQKEGTTRDVHFFF